jgi:glutamate 5-kinase
MVSSGAIALGMKLLNMAERPTSLAGLQAAAAIGQTELMNQYRSFFSTKGCHVAQVLLTWEDFNDRQRYLNAQNTLRTLLALRSLPVINENDTVATDEIRFGDNDRLSALVSSLVGADLLIIFSDVDGLLDSQRRRIPMVKEISPQIKALATSTNKKSSVGGMITKLEAAEIVMDAGIPCVIANGAAPGVLLGLIDDSQYCGTLFVPKKMLGAKKRWIAFSARPKGRVVVDAGASVALRNNKSLLAIGVTAAWGEFESGDIVTVVDAQGTEIARGKVCMSARNVNKIMGTRGQKEIIHRDNIVLLRRGLL